MLKQEKVFIVNLLLIAIAFCAGLYTQVVYKLMPQDVEIVTTEKVIIQKEVEIIEVPKDCPTEPKRKGFFD